MMIIKRPSLRQLSWLLGGSLVLCALFWLWLAVQQQEATLAIRPVGQGVSMPDGFSVWHHLDANGIRFKSITPQKDGLLIKFDSTAQGAAAKEVLGRALPHGYIIALLEDDNSATAWLSRLRDALTGSGKLPPYCVFYAVWWFPAFVTMLKPAGINAFPFTIGNGYILRVYPQTMEGTIHETPHRSASGPDFT